MRLEGMAAEARGGRRAGMRAWLVGLGLVAAAALSLAAAVSLSAGELAPGAITKIDMRTRMVTAHDPVTKQTFQFKVLDNGVLRDLKIGQPVFADFKGMRIALQPDRRPCCNIVTIALTGAAPAPCCAISAIHTPSGVVTGTEKATGRKFQFKVGDTTLLYGLRVGQPIYANFKARTVSLRSDGGAPCCLIVSR